MITNVNRGQPDLEAAMKSNTTTILVAVGALHLYGEGNLPDMLT